MENTKIEWAEDTWNPWYGCQKVSPGCTYCYMYRDRQHVDASVVFRSKTKFKDPLSFKEPRLIFTCSWSDWFVPDADQWRDEAWGIIKKTPYHTYLILTKRPERIRDNLPYNFKTYKNVWMGVSVESQEYVHRIEYLRGLPCTTFVSFEPLLGPITWNSTMSELDWIIIGGESGNDEGKFKYRKMELSWAVDLAHKAKENHVRVFMKQLGTYQAKKLGLLDKDGGNIKEFPESLRIREHPSSHEEKKERRKRNMGQQIQFDF